MVFRWAAQVFVICQSHYPLLYSSFFVISLLFRAKVFKNGIKKKFKYFIEMILYQTEFLSDHGAQGWRHSFEFSLSFCQSHHPIYSHNFLSFLYILDKYKY